MGSPKSLISHGKLDLGTRPAGVATHPAAYMFDNEQKTRRRSV